MSSSDAPTGSDTGAGSDNGVDDPDDEPTRAVCPFCGSDDSELESTFGSEVSKSQYYCNNCHTVFERIKYDGAMPDTGRDRDGTR
jgi:hypothetical protein